MEGALSPPSPLVPLKPSTLFTPMLCAMIALLIFSFSVGFYHFVLVRCFPGINQSSVVRRGAAQPRPPMYTPTGVDKILLDTIPIYSVVELNLDDFARECVVCMGDLADEDKVRLLPNCKHAFHLECIDQWFVGHDSCPLCRSPILAEKSANCEPFDSVSEHVIEIENQLDHEISTVSGHVNNDEITTSSSSEIELEIQPESGIATPPVVVATDLKISSSVNQSDVMIDLERGGSNRGSAELYRSNSSRPNLLRTGSVGRTSWTGGHFDRLVRSLSSRLRSVKVNDSSATSS